MTNQSQEQWVKNQLLTKGKVSRNQALRRYITRLAARIADLRKTYRIEGEWKITAHSKDYVYTIQK